MSDSEEEEIEVKVVTVEGKKYLINPLTNDVYDATTQKKIGVYNTETDEIEEEVDVKVFTHEGTKYLINPLTNDVYDATTQEKIGTYNKETDEIEEEDEEEEEEDEEEEEIEVKVFSSQGRKYLINPLTNEVYDIKTHEKLGFYNKRENRINEEAEDEEERKQREKDASKQKN